MNNYLLWVVIPNLDTFLGVSGGILLLYMGAFAVFWNFEYAEEEDFKEFSLKKSSTIVRLSIAAMICFFITVFLPSKEDIIALKSVEITRNIKGIKELPDNTVDLLNTFLKSMIKKASQ